MPYTAFYSKKSYLQDNKEILQKFNKALNKGLEYVSAHSEAEIAKTILPQFPDTSLKDLESIVKRYIESDSWYKTTFIKEEDFKNLEKLMIENNLLKDYVPYNTLIYNLSNE